MKEIKICKTEGCEEKVNARGYCNKCYLRHSIISLPRFSGPKIKGQTQTLLVDEEIEFLRSLVPKIKAKVLRDCIKNPRKYLGEYKGEDQDV